MLPLSAGIWRCAWWILVRWRLLLRAKVAAIRILLFALPVGFRCSFGQICVPLRQICGPLRQISGLCPRSLCISSSVVVCLGGWSSSFPARHIHLLGQISFTQISVSFFGWLRCCQSVCHPTLVCSGGFIRIVVLLVFGWCPCDICTALSWSVLCGFSCKLPISTMPFAWM